ncbi:MAG: hypothetical protein KIT19_06605 [Phycisphaeraceae bacterium]|nr:hypothetical protein [Phycisphaeraceae bacterium]
MSAFDDLRTKVRVLAGTAPSEPTDAQLHAIITALAALLYGGVELTRSVWIDAIERFVTSAHTHAYASMDMSDLNQILQEIIRKK